MNVQGSFKSKQKKTRTLDPSTENADENVEVPSPSTNPGKRKSPPSTCVEEVRSKAARVFVEAPSADPDTREEPIVEAEVLTLPAIDISELPPLFLSVSDSDFRSPLVQVWPLYG